MPVASSGSNITSSSQLNTGVVTSAKILDGTIAAADIADGTITDAKLATPAAFTGEIKMYGGASAPSGYLLCDGTAVSRTTYSALFALIASTYGGGDGSTTFNTPDLRGRIPVGVGTGTGGGSSGTGAPTGGTALTAIARGTWKGEETHVLTVAELAAHTHAASTNGHYNGFPGGAVGMSEGSAGATNLGSTGSDTAHNNIQPVMGVTFIIKT